jgi:hypothetical protein
MKRPDDNGTRMMENSLNRLTSFYTKANYATQVSSYFVARDDGKMMRSITSIPLERWERLF